MILVEVTLAVIEVMFKVIPETLTLPDGAIDTLFVCRTTLLVLELDVIRTKLDVALAKVVFDKMLIVLDTVKLPPTIAVLTVK